MKKLMIAATIVCVAAITQAAVSLQWAEGTAISPANDNTGTITSGRLYFIDEAKYSQQALFTALAETPDWTMDTVTSLASSKAYNSATLSTATKFNSSPAPTKGTVASGKISWDPTGDGYVAGNDYYFYQILVDGDNFYISDSVKVPLSDNGTSKANFANNESRTYSTPVALPATFEHGGWYTAVPEPTSGLLLLLGVAGLALRRRRA